MRFTCHVPGMTLYHGSARHWWQDITTDQVVGVARRLDELGYDYLTISEHLVLTPEMAEQYGPRWVHSLSAAGFVLGATSRIKLVVLVVVPYHGCIELAKALATLDYLSGGRLVVLALTGYQPWEFQTLGVPFTERGRMTDEFVDAMRILWAERRPSFHGRFVSFDDVVFEPKPAQAHVPIWMGGRTQAALRRVARRGDAWISYMTPRADVPAMLEYLWAQPELADAPRPIDISLPLYEGVRDVSTHKVVHQPEVRLDADHVLEQVRIVAGLGATLTEADGPLGTSVFQNSRPDAPPPTRSYEDYLERIQWFADEVLPAARSIEPVR
jgi:probable F420-dependent oxidoreductase